MKSLALCFVKLDSLLHHSGLTKWAIQYSFKQREHVDKLYWYRAFLFAVIFQVLTREVYCDVSMDVFIAALQWLKMNGFNQIFVLLLFLCVIFSFPSSKLGCSSLCARMMPVGASDTMGTIINFCKFTPLTSSSPCRRKTLNPLRSWTIGVPKYCSGSQSSCAWHLDNRPILFLSYEPVW